VGANLLRLIAGARHDTFGTGTRLAAWRLEGLPQNQIKVVDLLVDSNLDQLLDSIRPRTIFDCLAYSAYSFETDQAHYLLNFSFAFRLLVRLQDRDIAMYVHAGSSSEYGDNASGPKGDGFTAPNSHHAVSKVAVANLLYYDEKSWAFPARICVCIPCSVPWTIPQG
jgi:dolichol-phosphate mannosyltransferase